MSHFTVAVFTEQNGKPLEELLTPFNENITVERYVKATREQLIEESKKEVHDYATTGLYAEFLKDPEKYRSENKQHEHMNYIENEFPLRLQWADEEHYKNAIRYYEPEEIGENGEIHSTYNPNSKWDWYQIGGRWSGLLKLKSSALSGLRGSRSLLDKSGPLPIDMVDSAQIKDIDFEGMLQAQIQKRENLWKEAEGREDAIRYFEYGIEKGTTYEQHMKQAGCFTTFAVILPDGKWYEKGQMGWWACVSNEEAEWGEKYKERFIDTAEPEWTLTIVDCHI